MKYRICDLRHLRCFVAVGEEQVPPTKGRRGSISVKASPATTRAGRRQAGFVPCSIAAPGCWTRRTRCDRIVRIRLIRSGVSSSSRQKWRRSTMSSRRSVVATIVADRGSPSTRLISPKKSPGSSWLPVPTGVRTTAMPSMMTKNESPASPICVITVPTGASTTLERSATRRSSSSLNPLKSGTRCRCRLCGSREGSVAPALACSASSGSWKGKRSVDRGSTSIAPSCVHLSAATRVRTNQNQPEHHSTTQTRPTPWSLMTLVSPSVQRTRPWLTARGGRAGEGGARALRGAGSAPAQEQGIERPRPGTGGEQIDTAAHEKKVAADLEHGDRRCEHLGHRIPRLGEPAHTLVRIRELQQAFPEEDRARHQSQYDRGLGTGRRGVDETSNSFLKHHGSSPSFWLGVLRCLTRHNVGLDRGVLAPSAAPC